MSWFFASWYGTVLFIALCLSLYLLIGAYWGGRAEDAGWEADGDVEFAGFLVTVFYPFVALYMVASYVFHKPRQLGLSYSARKAKRTGIELPEPAVHKGKVVSGTSRITMHDDNYRDGPYG